MQLSTMRRVDYFVGIPLYFVLTLIVRALAVLRGDRADGAVPRGRRMSSAISVTNRGTS